MQCKGRLLFLLGVLFLLQAGGIAWSQVTERVSVDSAGGEANNASNNPSTSANGRYVAFESDAANLLMGTDTNGWSDIFVRDRQAGTTTRVSIHSDGITQGNNRSNSPSISADGMHVAFESWASNLVASGGDMFPDIYVHDRLAGTTSRVSVDSAGNEQPFESLAPSISADGRYVAFDSAAELVPQTNAINDIYVHDRDYDENGIYDEAAAGINTVRVSVRSDGTEGDAASSAPSISANGRYVAFESKATNLVPLGSDGSMHIFVHDRDADDDGIYDDEDGSYDPGEVSTVQVSVDAVGTEGDAGSSAPSISADGRYVAFESSATNLVPGGSDGSVHIFVHDRDADEDGIYDDEDGTYHPGEVSTVQVSVRSDGTEGDADSRAPSISADGRYVAFQSDASNLVASDSGSYSDVFVHDLQTRTTTRVSVDSAGTEGNDISWDPSISANGKYVAFESDAYNLVTGDDPPPIGFRDIFVYERESLLPTVDLTSPVDNATNASVDAGITATFSEPMQASTINTTTFTIDNGATGTVSYDANSTTATFTPTSNLNYDTTYTATITTGAEDLAGNGLLANYTWSFTTRSEENSSGNSGCFIDTAATSLVWQKR
jgi:Tol biopolymer transport system component